MATVRSLWSRWGVVTVVAHALGGCTVALDFDRTDLSVPDAMAPMDAPAPDVSTPDVVSRDSAPDTGRDASVDTGSDARVCACGDHQVCNAGACECEQGWADCNGRASDGCEVDLTESSSNCGRCLNRCESGLVCRSGACGCEGARQLCNGACVDTQANTANCGACGVSCGGMRCCSGVCLARCGG